MTIGPVYANATLDGCYGDNHGPTWPDDFEVCGFIGDPQDGGVEPTAGGYARIAVANTSANWPDAVARVKSNGVDFVFPESTGDWGGVVDHFAILDPAGEICDSGPLTSEIDITDTGQDARIVAETLIVSM